MAIRFESSAKTHQGLVRSTNEDSYLDDKALNLYIVCDGVGGQTAGNVASELCARSLRQRVYDHILKIQEYRAKPSQALRVELATILRDAVLAANQAIFQLGTIDANRKGMCTTVVALLALPDYAILAHVGDSRIYLTRAGKTHQLTEDHHYGLEMFKKGAFTQEQLKNSPYSRVLTRAVGNQTAVEVDTLQIELLAGDRFTLCSDGLYQYMEQRDFLGAIEKSSEESSEGFLKKALDHGANDNVTVIVVDVRGDEAVKPSAVSVLKKTDLLQKVPLFRYLSYPEIQKVLEIAQLREYKKDEIVMKDGEKSDELFVLMEGQVTVEKQGVKLAQKGEGDILGQMGFFDQAPRSADVRSNTPAKSLVWERELWMGLLRKEPSMAVKILWSVIGELNADLRSASRDFVEKSLAKSDSQPILQEYTKDFPFPFSKKV